MTKYFSCQNDPDLIDYLNDLLNPEDALLSKVNSKSKEAGLPEIQISALDSRHIDVIVRASKATMAVEIGTLGGYSAITIARALPENGKLYTFEFNARNAKIARENIANSDVANKIEVIEGAALDRLKEIENKGPFDLVFIDADKTNYVNYLKWADSNLKIGGTLLADNTFGFGMVYKKNIDAGHTEKAVEGIRAFNQAMCANKNFITTYLPTGEGLTFAVKVK